jgi:hypothetical protein
MTGVRAAAGGRTYDWHGLLRRWSEAWLDPGLPEHEQPPEPFSAEVRRARWLGTAPAAPQEIGALESRLGTELPPSYRQFLLHSDGWGPVTHEIDRLLPVREVDWAARGRLSRALLVGHTPGEVDTYLLDPGAVSPDGEWEAWHLVPWPPGGVFRHRSFWDLMNAEYESFRGFVTPPAGPDRSAAAPPGTAPGADAAGRAS